jgi:hypothetical protein
MPTIPPYVIGIPGQRAPQIATPRAIFYSADRGWLPGGKYIDGSKSRDTNNGPTDVDRLQAGLLMGKVTSTGYYANWSIDQLTVAYTSGTSMTIGTSGATELVRRVGSTGSFVLTGVPAAGLTVRQTTVAYSAVNTSTGVITVTAPTGASEVQQITFNGTGTTGNLVLVVPKPDGTTVTTAAIGFTTNAAYITAINNAIDTALGTAGLWVASGASIATDITLTASSTYANQSFPGLFQVTTFPTGNLSAIVSRSTTGVPIAFTIGSVLSQADGSQVPVTFLPDGFPMEVTDGSGNVAQVEFPAFPVGGIIDQQFLIGYSAMDASLKTYVLNQLSSVLGGKYAFRSAF